MNKDGVLPAKASAFVVVERPGGKVLCTIEGPDACIGVPGGKWEPAADGPSWDRLLAREYAEEVGAALPEATHAGYLEWGSAAYQVRFAFLSVSEAAAAAIPVGAAADPAGAVRELRWIRPRDMAKAGPVRPHVATALRILDTSAIVARDVARPVKRSAARGAKQGAPRPGDEAEDALAAALGAL